jgi:hypothetical protein
MSNTTVRSELPMPTGQTQLPLFRLKRRHDHGIIGFEWIEVLAVVQGNTTLHACPDAGTWLHHSVAFVCRVPHDEIAAIEILHAEDLDSDEYEVCVDNHPNQNGVKTC